MGCTRGFNHQNKHLKHVNKNLKFEIINYRWQYLESFKTFAAK